MTVLNKIKVEKVTSKNTKRALRNRNAIKTTVLFRRSDYRIYSIVSRDLYIFSSFHAA